MLPSQASSSADHGHGSEIAVADIDTTAATDKHKYRRLLAGLSEIDIVLEMDHQSAVCKIQTLMAVAALNDEPALQLMSKIAKVPPPHYHNHHHHHQHHHQHQHSVAVQVARSVMIGAAVETQTRTEESMDEILAIVKQERMLQRKKKNER
jgi:hypothetical protein